MEAEFGETRDALGNSELVNLATEAINGGATRRQFFARAAVLGVSLTAASAILTACQSNAATASTTPGAGGASLTPLTKFPLKITSAYKSITGLKAGYVGADFTNPFGLAQNAFLKAHAQGVGWEFQGFDGQLNSGKMNQYMAQLTNQGYSVIYVNPIDAAGISPSIETAKQAGIIVITTELWSLAYPTYGTLVDFVQQGGIAATWLGSNLPSGANVISIVGPLSGAAGIGRKTGFDATAKTAGLNVLESSDQGGWSRSTAHDLFAGMLLKYPKIDGVFCGNDDMGLGIELAATQANRRSQMKLIGCDMVKEGQDAVKSGQLDASIGQNYEVQGYVAGAFAEGLLRGGYSGNGSYGIYSVAVYPVDKTNVNSVWQSPF